MPLLNLPNELLVPVVLALATAGDVYALLRVNRRLALLAAPVLRNFMLHDPQCCALAILWAAACDNKPQLRDVLGNNKVPGLLVMGYGYNGLNIDWDSSDATLDMIVEGVASLLVVWKQNGNENENENGHGRTRQQQPQQLFLAVQANNSALVRLLLERGSNGRLRGYGKTLLHIAACRKQRKVLEVLLCDGNARDDVNIADANGWTALHEALRVVVDTDNMPPPDIDIGIVKLLLEKGSNPNAQTQSGNTSLHMATDIVSEPVSQAIVAILLDHGANLTLRNSEGQTPLDLSLQLVHQRLTTNEPPRLRQDLAKLMLARMNYNLPDDLGKRVLYTAVQCLWDDEIIQLLLPRVADIAAQDQDGKTALHMAVQSSGGRAVPLLLVAGIDSTIRDHSGQTALHTAARIPTLGPILCLLNHGADLSARDNEGRTPLHIAALYGRWAHCTVLLGSGAKANDRDSYGLTARDVATLQLAMRVHTSTLLEDRYSRYRPNLEQDIQKEAWASPLDNGARES